jgi:hypothetical protein
MGECRETPQHCLLALDDKAILSDTEMTMGATVFITTIMEV